MTVVQDASAAEAAPSRGGDAASLGAIQVRRGARTARVGNKQGDLTQRLRRPAVIERSPAPAKSGEQHTAPPAPPSPGPARSDADLTEYWNTLRGGRELPSFAGLDRGHVAAEWPNTLLVSYGDGAKTMPQIARLGRFTGEIEFTSMVTEWILACARQVANGGKPVEKEQDFPVEHRSKRYRMLLLPLATGGAGADRVLCRLSCRD